MLSWEEDSSIIVPYKSKEEDTVLQGNTVTLCLPPVTTLVQFFLELMVVPEKIESAFVFFLMLCKVTK